MAGPDAERRHRRGLRSPSRSISTDPALSYLVDTNVLSELRKGTRCDARVAEWFSAIPDDEIWLSVLVVGEVRRGIEVLRRRDPANAMALDRWLSGLVRDHGDRILGIDRAVAEEWGKLAARRTVSVVDGLLAATARVHGLTLATRNVRDVAWTGVPWINPFGGPPSRERA